ncbi:MAG TPA: HAMP domain-containing sensor histidine kinase [Candidatus Eremiobacteraceae bacterium]|nr:HAMP domain-containing sensor histidine kinase [Candidatus Eremiobacteraceae bacterium]
MTAKQGVPVAAIAAHCALVALWLVLAVGISAFALHLSTSAVNYGDVQLADAASGLGRMAASLSAAGASEVQLTTSITAAAKARGLSVSSQSMPRPPEPDPRLPVPPPFGLMVPTQILSPSGPFESPSAVLHVADTMFVFQLEDDPVMNVERWYAISMIALFVIAILVSFLVQRRTLRRALAPVTTIESALRRLAVGEYARLEMFGDESSPGVVGAYNAAADELASSIRLRAEAEANLRQFVADAGHELRTPLTVVMGFVDVLRQGAIAEQALAQRILDSVAVEGERMRRLITRMLMLARLDAVAPERRESVDLSQVVADTVQSFEPLRGTTSLATKLDPDVSVAGSASDVREIVGILVDNAIKYAPGSHVVASTTRDDRYGILTVTDDGPGMPPELRVRAFDRFSRGDERGSVPGSGLGLAIVKRIAVRADGDVDLESGPGKGTQVRVRLPIADGLVRGVGVQ